MAHALTVAVLALIAVGVAQAQTLADPTRPPSSLGGAVAADGSTSGDTAIGPSLQAILRQPGQKPRALLNGEWLEQGQRNGDMRLLKVGTDRVEITGPRGKETVRLMPDVDKRAVVGKSSQGASK